MIVIKRVLKPLTGNQVLSSILPSRSSIFYVIILQFNIKTSPISSRYVFQYTIPSSQT